MPSKRYTRVVYNRSVFEAIDLGLADGVARLAQAIVDTADIWDAPPYGKGLVQRGGQITFLNGRQVSGTASRPTREWVAARGVVAFAGYGFPGRFQELGTVNQPPRPRITPAMEQQMEYLDSHMAPAMLARLAAAR